MPRIFRILPENGFLHILTRGNNRQIVFHDNNDYESYINLIKNYKHENKVKICHYCLMPNHIHLIVEISTESNLPRFMKQLNLAYLHYYKKKYKYDGHLWQGRYKSLIISKDEYLIACAKYIELNPLKAKIVNNPKEYKYSSYSAYAYGKEDEIVEYDPIYLDWGKTDKERQLYYRKYLNEKMKTISLNLNARFIGADDFIKQMENDFKVVNLNGKRGRPRTTKNK